MVVEECRRLGISYLTLFSFSTENWLRPQEEVSGLMRLFCEYVRSERDLLLRHDIRLRAIGARARLPPDVRTALEDIERDTAHCHAMQLILALSYGGRDEIVHATKAIAVMCMEGRCHPTEITEASIQANLFAPDVPDPDVVIRTGDECRLSNFLLWQSAYAELVVSEQHWPAFSAQDLSNCLAEFARRTRRFGMTDEQLEQRV
jgi:undecaprenyl diphosphate synthase